MTAYLRILTHRCTIQRNYPTQNEIGEDEDNWTDLNTNQPCRLIMGGSQEPPADLKRLTQQIPYEYMLLLPPDTGVTAVDQITTIVFDDGTPYSGDFSIEKMYDRRSKNRGYLTALILERVE